jgi:quercetin dioxygenase-like cupin family protein
MTTVFYDHGSTKLFSLDEGQLRGLRHRTVIDSSTGSKELALWQEEHEAGFEVPLHWHDCEEIITVLEGRICARLGDATQLVGPLQSILIPAREPHGFRVEGDRPVRLLALFSAAAPKVYRMDGQQSLPPWEGGESGHLSIARRHK